MHPARMLLDLLKAPGLCMVCYGNVSCMRHVYGKSFDHTKFGIPRIYARDTIFLDLMAVVKVRDAP